MKVEVIEFYPRKSKSQKSNIIGTFHVYLTELDIDLKGVFITQKKNRVFICRPYFFAVDSETGKKVRVPIVGFANQEKDRALKKALEKECKAYLKKNVPDTTKKK